MKKVIVCFVLLVLVGISFGQAKPGGSVTAMVSSQNGIAMGFGGGFNFFINRYFGGGADVTFGRKSYDVSTTTGSMTQTTTGDISSLAIDAYFAPRIEFDRGRIYPLAGLTVYNAKEESTSGSTTIEYDYGTNIGFLFGMGAEVHYRKQIVFGAKVKQRLVTGTEETTTEGSTVENELPIGGTEVGFTIGLLF